MNSPDTIPWPYRLIAIVVTVLALPVTLPVWLFAQLQRHIVDRVWDWDTAPMPTPELERRAA